jgi:NitT/TauT family transport system ATP-binding protein
VQENQILNEEELLRELQAALPHEKPRPLFRSLLAWGRHAEIITYDQRKHELHLYAGKRMGRQAATATLVLPPAAPPAA